MMRRPFLSFALMPAFVLLVNSQVAMGQDLPATTEPAANGPVQSVPAWDGAAPGGFRIFDSGNTPPNFLTGNRDFPNFIGFLSNPIQSIDPRAVTQIWPMFGSAWASAERSILPSGDMQTYGAGLNVALSDRLSFGLNNGGYAIARFDRDREALRARLGLPVRDVDRSGNRHGWLNLGGWFQYTLIADVPNQFILTAGLRWEAPSGSTRIFQGGDSPVYLSPYLTVGKEFGCYHLLATTGYEFPAGRGEATTNTYYFNLHVDRKIGWLYPLAEFNFAYRTTNADINIATPRHGVLDLGTFTTTGTSLTAAVGANAVLIPTKLEFGAVYVRPLAPQGRFDFNGVLVKMVYRF